MGKSIEVSAKTLDDAVEKGLAELGVGRESVTIEVLENAKPGFLGIGSVQAKIKMTELSDEELFGSLEEKAPASAPKKQAAPAKSESPDKKKPAADHAPAKSAAPLGTTSAAEFLERVLRDINSEARIEPRESGEEGVLRFEITGSKLGNVIGRRGETLDALQHLAGLVEHRRTGDKARIMLDAENYRTRRAESVERYALRMADQVLRNKKNKVLEPMNAYERHIVHVALQDVSDISTSSIGVEPHRKVVISYKGADAPHRGSRQGGRLS